MSYNNATVIPFMGLMHLVNQQDKLSGIVLTNGKGTSIGFDKSFITTTVDNEEHTQPLTKESLVSELSLLYTHVALYNDFIDMDVLIDTSGNWIGFTANKIHMGTKVEDLSACVIIPYTLSVLCDNIINNLKVA